MLGDETGYFGLDIADKDLIAGKELSVVGYPYFVGDKERREQIWEGYYYQYGMSGEPIFNE